MIHMRFFVIIMAGTLLFSGCSERPVEEMMQAETAIQIAQAAGADEYAAADLGAAVAALADAKSRIERKDYEGGRASALEAFKKAGQAENNIVAGKRSMRAELDKAYVLLQEEWTPLDQELAKQKWNKSQQEALYERRRVTIESLDQINIHKDAGNYTGALSLLKSARENVKSIRDMMNK